MGAPSSGWVNYGQPRFVPEDAQMYVLTNEQVNFKF